MRWLRDDGTAVSLAGCTARMQVREDTQDAALLIELSTDNGRIFVNGPEGLIHLVLTAAETALFPVPSGAWPNVRSWVHDLVVTDPLGQVLRTIRGRFIVTATVTRS